MAHWGYLLPVQIHSHDGRMKQVEVVVVEVVVMMMMVMILRTIDSSKHWVDERMIMVKN
jgi:hypothetical protein